MLENVKRRVWVHQRIALYQSYLLLFTYLLTLLFDVGRVIVTARYGRAAGEIIPEL